MVFRKQEVLYYVIKKKLWKKMAAMAVLGTAFVLGGHAMAAEAAANPAAAANETKTVMEQKGAPDS